MQVYDPGGTGAVLAPVFLAAAEAVVAAPARLFAAADADADGLLAAAELAASAKVAN